MTITADIQTLAPGAIIELFEIDITPLGGSLLRFHAGTNGLMQPVVWQGNTYQPMPIQAQGFDFSGQGQLPRPTLTIANITGIVSAYILQYDDLAGVKVTRHRTLAKYLDGVNFPIPAGAFTNVSNLLKYPSDYTQSVWTKRTSTVVSNYAAAPDGTQSVSQINFHANTDAIYELWTGAVPAGQQYTVDVWLASETVTKVGFGFNGKTNGANNVCQTITLTPTLTRYTFTLTCAADTGLYFVVSTKAISSESGVGQTGTFKMWNARLYAGADTPPISANPSADPTAEFPLDIYFIDRKASETKQQVQFELSAAFDVEGVQLPKRQIIQNICTWQYKGPECGYSGTAYFKYDDTPTSDPSQDTCGKRLSSCKCRFGQYVALPYGGFPAAGLVRQ